MGHEKVWKLGIQREPGWLYYVDGCDVLRVRMVRGGQPKPPDSGPEPLATTKIKREDGFIYYLDKQGDVSRCAISRSKVRKSGKKKTPPKERKPTVASLRRELNEKLSGLDEEEQIKVLSSAIERANYWACEVIG